MIVLRCRQGSPEWVRARIGIPTTSKFDKIITAKKLNYSSQAEKYRNELLGEWLSGYPADADFANKWTDRGTDLEPEARAKYELMHDVEVEQVGFIMRDDRMVGCSPDGLVEDDGGLEIKAPATHTHIGYLLNPESLVEEYVTQVQGSLFLTRRKWWDIMSYHPTLKDVRVRVEPDPDFQEAFAGHLENFIAELNAGRQKLLDMGLKPAPPLPTAESLMEQDQQEAAA